MEKEILKYYEDIVALIKSNKKEDALTILQDKAGPLILKLDDFTRRDYQDLYDQVYDFINDIPYSSLEEIEDTLKQLINKNN